MDNQLDKFIREFKKIGLDRAEKFFVRQSLMRGITPPLHEWHMPKLVPIMAALLISVVVGGGVSFAAENSLPGDLLYAIKININEEVRAALAVSNVAKADLEARLAERRIEEAEKLAERGELNEEKRAELESKLRNHAERAKEKIAKLEDENDFEDAAEADSNLEIALRSRAKIISQEFNHDSDERLTASLMSVEREIDGWKKAAENKIAAVRKLVSGAEASAKLKIAEEALAVGKTKSDFKKAHRFAQEAKLFLQEDKAD